MEIIKSYLLDNDCYKANVKKVDGRYSFFQQEGAKGLMLHSVGCAQPNATVFVSNWNKPGVDKAVHAFVDANNGKVYQTMPWNFRGWHCAGTGNNTHIGVEMCESGYIKYTAGGKFEVLNLELAQADCRRAYNSAVALLAHLCTGLHLDPLTDICSHKEGYAKGIASNHGDPEHYWQGLGMPYTMVGFRKAVQRKMNDDILTVEDVQKMIDEAIAKRLGKWIGDINDIPSKAVKKEVRVLLDCEAINGGTSYTKNPDDINLAYDVLRALVMAKRYTDYKAKGGG